MINEYSRTELLIGSENMEKLKKASVAVFGVGGVGSHCIEALARCGIGRLILIDNDDVSLTNINRQSIAYHSTIGRMKTDVMRERIKTSIRISKWKHTRLLFCRTMQKNFWNRSELFII